jgi:hypothetical protein
LEELCVDGGQYQHGFSRCGLGVWSQLVWLRRGPGGGLLLKR